MIALTTRFLDLSIDPEKACFSLSVLRSEAALRNESAPRNEVVQLQNATFEIETLQNGRTVCPLRLVGCNTSQPKQVESLHGPLTTVRLDFAPSTVGLCVQIEFALAENLPMCLWRKYFVAESLSSLRQNRNAPRAIPALLRRDTKRRLHCS